jgi:hypothetical protein
MPIAVNDISVAHTLGEHCEVWIEYRVDAIDDDPVDPQATAFTITKIAYRVFDPSKTVTINGVQVQVVGGETTDPENPLWHAIVVQQSVDAITSGLT